MKTCHHGTCLCGTVRFRIEGRIERFYLCHCRHCQKDTGSAHAANLFVTDAGLDWLAGAGRVRHYALPGTRHARSFCVTCGSALPWQSGTSAVVPAGSLDDPPDRRPDGHLFTASRAAWDHDLACLPAFEGLPR